MDYNIEYLDGYKLSINKIKNYEKYFVIIGDDVPRCRFYNVYKDYLITLNYKYYIEYITQIYGWDDKGAVLLIKEIFDIKDKIVFFDMYPKDIDDIKIWINYIESFSKIKGCNPVYRINNIDFNKNNYNIVYYQDSLNSYASYNISWTEDYNRNPYGINLTSYELINSILLRI